MNLNDKLNELMKDSAFVDAINQVKTLEETMQLLNSMGISVSQQEWQYVQMAEDHNGFLSEESLEFVSGGAPTVPVMQLLMPKLLSRK